MCVKIPVSNPRGEPAYGLVRRLSQDSLQFNVTAVMTADQVRDVTDALTGGAASCISVFAGRIADTGRDPAPLMAEALRVMTRAPNAELILASPREVLNIRLTHSKCSITTPLRRGFFDLKTNWDRDDENSTAGLHRHNKTQTGRDTSGPIARDRESGVRADRFVHSAAGAPSSGHKGLLFSPRADSADGAPAVGPHRVWHGRPGSTGAGCSESSEPGGPTPPGR